MKIAPKPENELQRLAALRQYNLLDTPEEREYEDVVALASSICGTPMSSITLIDESRQWHKARIGLPDKEGSRDLAFCSHAILQEEVMIVPDATKDIRFSDNPFVIGNPNIRFYAGMPLTNPDGFKLGTLCVIDDQARELSESQLFALKVLGSQVSKQMELRKQMHEVQHLNETNAKLLSIISHDLRSPMVSLHGLLELVEKHNLSAEEFKEYIAKVRSQFNSTSELLSNLLAWATLQFSNAEPRVDEITISTLIDDVIESCANDLNKKQNEIIKQVENTLRIVGDPNMVKAVVRNLLLNANKFTDKGSITISANEIGDSIEVCVTDTGVGMDAARLENIFSWSARSSSLGTSGEPGSGFGLLVCKDFLEKNKGGIRATSAPGRGSSFYFTLPRG